VTKSSIKFSIGKWILLRLNFVKQMGFSSFCKVNLDLIWLIFSQTVVIVIHGNLVKLFRLRQLPLVLQNSLVTVSLQWLNTKPKVYMMTKCVCKICLVL